MCTTSCEYAENSHLYIDRILHELSFNINIYETSLGNVIK